MTYRIGDVWMMRCGEKARVTHTHAEGCFVDFPDVAHPARFTSSRNNLGRVWDDEECGADLCELLSTGKAEQTGRVLVFQRRGAK